MNCIPHSFNDVLFPATFVSVTFPVIPLRITLRVNVCMVVGHVGELGCCLHVLFLLCIFLLSLSVYVLVPVLLHPLVFR